MTIEELSKDDRGERRIIEIISFANVAGNGLHLLRGE